MNKIREIATAKNIKISQLIKTTKLSRSFFYDIMNEQSFPTIPVGQKIARSLNSTIDEVFPDKGE